MALGVHEPDTSNTPRIGVIVPTYGRPDRIRTLVERLGAQTLAPDLFEVIVVDDGTPDPIALDAASCPFPLKVLRQPNSGPAAARNLGTAHARAPLVIFLNDDAVPHADLLALHLEAHASAGGERIAVMGSFPFTQRSLEEPFTKLLERSNLLFDFPGLRHGQLHGWTFFWTCNVSLPRALLEEVGGFDAETFREAIVEDVELGWRLERKGVRVLYREDAVCEHEHPLRFEDYFRRAHRLGVNAAKMWRKHRDMRILWQPPETTLRDFLRNAQLNAEHLLPRVEPFLDVARRWSERVRGRPSPREEAAKMEGLVRQLSLGPVFRGMISELTGHDVQEAMAQAPRPGALTSIVICSHDALPKTKACLESIRRTADPDHPTEIVCVDNGSSDGSAEWLAAQRDVRLIRNGENLGAPAARNQALAVARGEYVAILDNDLVVTPGWLKRLLWHAEVDPAAGCIGACADRASHGQEVPYAGPTDFASLSRFAADVGRSRDRVGRAAVTLASFCILVRKALVDRIGGFDERFSPWGFEDDDFTLRCFLAGHHSRIAHDVWVHHDTYAGPKLERHARLLEENWKRFAQKWGFAGARYGDFSGLAPVRERAWTDAELHVPLRPPAAEARPGPAGAPRLSIVVVAQGAWDETLRCLSSLAPAAVGVSHEVIAVDDGTSDETAAALPRLAGVLAIRSEVPRGFAAAANAGASQARAPVVAFVHGDAFPRPGSLATLSALLEADPKVAAAAARLVTPDETVESDGVAFRYGDPYPLTPFPVGAGAAASPSGEVTEVPAAFFVTAAVRAAALRVADGFDETLSGPAAEIDLALRLRAAGGLVLAAQGATAVHHGTCPGEIPDVDLARLTRAWLGRVPLLDGRHGAPASPPRPGRPAVSVVVPAGDALRTIAPCLEGVLRNLGPSDELVVADAGAADGTREYAELLARDRAGRVRVLPAERGGAAALRAGLAAASHRLALLVHPGVGAPDGFVDGLTDLLAAQGDGVVIALPTGAGVCAAGRLDALRRLSDASADAFFSPDLAAMDRAAAASGTRVAAVT